MTTVSSDHKCRLTDRMLIGGLRLVPQNGMSRMVGAVAAIPIPRILRRPVLGGIASLVGIAVQEAEHPLVEYSSFSKLFTRRLKEDARPISENPNALISPCDGILGEVGQIKDGKLLQVKGRHYSLSRFVSDDKSAKVFQNGRFITIYLSPRHYHRVHSPIGGDITGYHHIPGHLFPVNRAGVHHVDELFAVNERVLTYLDAGPWGQVVVAMVGATSVGRISMAYDNIVANTKSSDNFTKTTYETPKAVAVGDELGCFCLGSTVVMLVENPDYLQREIEGGSPLTMGQEIGQLFQK